MLENMKSMHTSDGSAERAIDELRRGSGLVFTGTGTPFAFLPVESLTLEQWAAFRALPDANPRVVITGARAKSIGLAGQSASPVQIDASKLSFEQVRYLADPLADKTSLANLAAAPAAEPYRLALTLAKYASLLPAVLILENDGKAWQSIDTDSVRRTIETPQTDIIETARATLPLEHAEATTIVSYRARHGASVHLALIIGKPEADVTPLVRVHSSCVTGDILGSLRCDCGDQLRLALEEIKKNGSGILVYLHQEGRGIGITNKLRAYALQEQGADTYEANLMLGFEEDERDFAIAGAILKKLGVDNIRLMTNNPHKIESLKGQGIAINERVPLVAAGSQHSHAYLDAKAKKSGHLF